MLDRLERLFVGVGHDVGEARHLGVQLPAAQLLRIDVLLDGERGELRARHRQHRALAHHAEVRQHRVPGRGAVGVAERRGHPRRLAHALVLRAVVAEQRAHAARAHVVGHARAGGFAQEHHRQAAAAWPRASCVRSCGRWWRCDDAPMTVKSLATTAHSRPSILPKPAILPSAGDLSRSSGRVAEVPNRPDSMNVPASTRYIDALARVENARSLAPCELLRPAHGERLGALGLVGILHWRPSPPVPCDPWLGLSRS